MAYNMRKKYIQHMKFKKTKGVPKIPYMSNDTSKSKIFLYSIQAWTEKQKSKDTIFSVNLELLNQYQKSQTKKYKVFVNLA